MSDFYSPEYQEHEYRNEQQQIRAWEEEELAEALLRMELDEERAEDIRIEAQWELTQADAEDEVWDEEDDVDQILRDHFVNYMD